MKDTPSIFEIPSPYTLDTPWSPEATAKKQRHKKDARRIGIIGAGASGIHMAWLLRKRGFTNIVLLEKTQRSGGKVCTVRSQGMLHEMGACYTTPAYHQLRGLAKELGLYQPISVAGREVYTVDGKSISFGDWVIDRSRQELGGWWKMLPRKLIGLRILWDIRRYVSLHKKILGEYIGSFPPRPSKASLAFLDCSFKDYLQKHGLVTLIPVMKLFQTAQGYGYIKHVPAYYGLLWNNPDTMKIIVEQMTGRAKEGGASLLRAGMESLFTAMVKRGGLKIEYGQNISSIHRADSHVSVKSAQEDGSSPKEYVFDLLFVSANAKACLPVFDAPTKEEVRAFSRQSSCQMTTTLQSGVQDGRHGIDSWMYHCEPKKDHHVITQRLTEYFVSPSHYRRHRDQKSDVRVTFQFGERRVEDAFIDDQYADHFADQDKEWAVRKHKVLDRRYWSDYFPHWSQKEIQAGLPWDVLDIQGRNRTFWIGASTSFESLRDVLNYNLLIMDRFFDRDLR